MEVLNSIGHWLLLSKLTIPGCQGTVRSFADYHLADTFFSKLEKLVIWDVLARELKELVALHWLMCSITVALLMIHPMEDINNHLYTTFSLLNEHCGTHLTNLDFTFPRVVEPHPIP